MNAMRVIFEGRSEKIAEKRTTLKLRKYIDFSSYISFSNVVRHLRETTTTTTNVVSSNSLQLISFHNG